MSKSYFLFLIILVSLHSTLSFDIFRTILMSASPRTRGILDVVTTIFKTSDDQVPEAVTGRIVDEPPSGCGRRALPHTPLITDGRPTKPGEWPWHAAIYRMTAASNKKGYICGGTLLSNTRIITAAHCTLEKWAPIDPARLSVILGKFYLFEEEAIAQKRDVSNVRVHPEFNRTNMANDLAILMLVSPVTYNDFIRPICLWRANSKHDIVNKYGYVVGWGYTSDYNFSSVLTEASLHVVTDVDCIRTDPLYFIQFITDMTYCAGNRNTTSVCNGDSGDGMFFSQQTQDAGEEVWYLRGLVSLGRIRKDTKRCDPEQYTIFTYVDEYLKFIKENL